MRGIIDWSKVNLKTKEGQNQFRGAIQHYLSGPDRIPELKAAIQMFTTKGDFPTQALQVIEKFHQTPSFDNSYESIFDIRDFTGTRESGFDMTDVGSGLTFDEVPIGAKVNVKKMFGSKSTVSFVRYGGALGWDRTWFDDGQYWTMEDTLMEFQNQAYYARAAAFYALIDAITSAQNLAWQAASPSGLAATDARYVMSRDVNTINKACEEILLDCKDKGFGVTANSPFIILAPIQLKARINQALAWADLTQGGVKALQYNVTPAFSLMLSSSSVYYVCLPKKTAKGGYRQDLTLFSDFDILSYIDQMAGWMRFGGAIGDVEQFQRCATS